MIFLAGKAKNSFKELILENPDGIVNFCAFTNRASAKKDVDASSSSSESEGSVLLDEVRSYAPFF